MKCISLWQPWATLMAIGAKQIETRSWLTSHRGLLAIHAGKRWTEDLRALTTVEPFRTALRNNQVEIGESPVLPLGCVVGVVNVVDCWPATRIVPTLHHFGPHEREFGDFTSGRFGWVTDWRYQLKSPFTFRGAQGLFDVPDELVADAIAARKEVEIP